MVLIDKKKIFRQLLKFLNGRKLFSIVNMPDKLISSDSVQHIGRNLHVYLSNIFSVSSEYKYGTTHTSMGTASKPLLFGIPCKFDVSHYFNKSYVQTFFLHFFLALSVDNLLDPVFSILKFLF